MLLSGRVSLPMFFFFRVNLEDIFGPSHFHITFKFPREVCQVTEKSVDSDWDCNDVRTSMARVGIFAPLNCPGFECVVSQII